MNTSNVKMRMRKWFGLILLLAIIAAGAWLTQKYHHMCLTGHVIAVTVLSETSHNVLQQVDQTILFTVLARKAATERQDCFASGRKIYLSKTRY